MAHFLGSVGARFLIVSWAQWGFVFHRFQPSCSQRFLFSVTERNAGVVHPGVRLSNTTNHTTTNKTTHKTTSNIMCVKRSVHC